MVLSSQILAWLPSPRPWLLLLLRPWLQRCGQSCAVTPALSPTYMRSRCVTAAEKIDTWRRMSILARSRSIFASAAISVAAAFTSTTEPAMILTRWWYHIRRTVRIARPPTSMVAALPYSTGATMSMERMVSNPGNAPTSSSGAAALLLWRSQGSRGQQYSGELSSETNASQGASEPLVMLISGRLI
mmetsp:Transcript_39713/g.84758  ORF Transcript_39713/g.84758 Transcript_39713/m.84758 type:complete len:187 (+) Transcript_39713:595-1155(+)